MIDFIESLIKKEKNEQLYRIVKNEVRKIFSKDEQNLEDSITCFSSLASLLLKNNETNIHELLNIVRDSNKLAHFKPATENQVQIMTYHKSKGLEFDLVIMLDCYKYIFPYESIEGYGNDFKNSENLHYVGLTRAKKAVYILLGTTRFRPKRQDFTIAQESIFISRHQLDTIRITYGSNFYISNLYVSLFVSTIFRSDFLEISYTIATL
jgi:DNA helicase-2/ATP-dependent DNA helicase PcrA